MKWSKNWRAQTELSTMDQLPPTEKNEPKLGEEMDCASLKLTARKCDISTRLSARVDWHGFFGE